MNPERRIDRPSNGVSEVFVFLDTVTNQRRIYLNGRYIMVRPNRDRSKLAQGKKPAAEFNQTTSVFNKAVAPITKIAASGRVFSSRDKPRNKPYSKDQLKDRFVSRKVSYSADKTSLKKESCSSKNTQTMVYKGEELQNYVNNFFLKIHNVYITQNIIKA